MPISEEIWDMKYRYKDHSGTPQETIYDGNVQDTWTRIAKALAACEKDPDVWWPKFYEALEGFKFLPAGRIIAGAGIERNVTLFNCYVMGTIPDSMEGIFDMLKEAALTMQQGGGIGYDFSTLRPQGAPVRGVAADASGPLTFMDVWDSMCRTVMSAGSRRGAMMATMRCDHPDILQFVEAKQDPTRLRMFNVSVLVTDAFMEAVENDEEWELVHEVQPLELQNGFLHDTCADGTKEWVSERDDGKWVYETVKARDLWDRIMRSTYDYAEPGVIFIDRINKDNNLWYVETISATNPCGEQPLPPYGACLLGSINLTRFVVNPFRENANVNQGELEAVVRMAVRMMDNVNSVSKFPLIQQVRESQAKRRIGLGITGLADMLAMLRVRYDSEEGITWAGKLMEIISIAAYDASVELAKEKSPFPAFDADKFLGGENMATRLPSWLKDKIRKHGIRNSHLTSIAPTGTISLYAGNVSSGIEPIFALSYNRKVLQPDGSRKEQRVEDYAVKAYWSRSDLDTTPDATEDLPDYFVTAQELKPLDHIRMQAAVQPWVDTSISKTVNLPKEISFEDFERVYMAAYETGCKGCTTYRPNDVTGSVISVEEKPAETVSVEGPEDTVVYNGLKSFAEFDAMSEAQLAERPDVLEGKTYKVKMGGEPAFYVTLTDIVEHGRRRPFEVFINTKNPEHIAWSTALTRMISAIFRRPHDSSFVVEELKNVFDPKGGGFWRGSYRPSVVAAIGQIIEDHMRTINYLEPAEYKPVEFATEAKGPTCLKCFSFNVKMENGCMTCADCGYSECG